MRSERMWPHSARLLEGGLWPGADCAVRAGEGTFRRDVKARADGQLAYTKHVAQQTRAALLRQQGELGWVGGVPPDDEPLVFTAS
jgi:hypothetical protein